MSVKIPAWMTSSFVPAGGHCCEPRADREEGGEEAREEHEL